uniref:Prenyl transferase n=1 Tax=Gracilaria caudata TaxID=2572395 RepID=A0A345U6P1_9FLOR|nr:prenyl transferase [Gracilaria caudata]YP_010196171.1 prenyl transferase [Gracilaria caudata]AXI96127.1 prenyl transferase [Gracilaria caudata]UAD83568.1 prenyl transferase [Gracilaria caudata]
MTILPKILPSVQKDLLILETNLQKMVSAKHPILYAAAEHLFSAGGKRIRPTIIFLIAFSTTKTLNILPEHKRLAEITEIIHTASLVHDDVIDECATRRGVNTVHNTFSTKVAVLAGDFLFAQSSWYLANLNNLEVVKAISKVITDFAEGEVRQSLTCFDADISMDNYIEKSFYKTASLIASSCKAAAILSETSPNIQNQFYLYGKHLGLAFQIVDDILDIIGSQVSLGKPAGSDLKNGNLTAPLIFALQENSALYTFIEREFEQNNDIPKTIEIIKNSNGIQKSYDLAQEHIQASIQAISKINNNLAQKSLSYINNYVIKRLN